MRILKKKDENCTSIRTENTLALLIPNHFVLDDCPRGMDNTNVREGVGNSNTEGTWDPVIKRMPRKEAFNIPYMHNSYHFDTHVRDIQTSFNLKKNFKRARHLV